MNDEITTAASTRNANVARLMVDLLDEAADRPAFVRLAEDGRMDHVVTFQRLHELVGAFAGSLRERGIGPGSKVVVFVPMGLELYVTLLAIFRLGATATFIEPWGGRKLVDQAAALVDADAFVGIPKSFLLRMSSPALRRVPLAVATGPRRIPGAERFGDLLTVPSARRVDEAAEVDDDDPALITFTTGSSGAPKGANRTHAILMAQHEALAAQVPDIEGPLVWTNLPIVVLHDIGRGVPTVLPPDRVGQDPMPDPKRFHGLLARSGATILCLSPAPLAQLGKAPGRSPLHEVQRVYTGGGPVLPGMLEQARAVLPNATITALYGSTEAEPIAHARAEEVLARRADMRRRGGIFVGHDVDEVRLLIVRSVDGAFELAPGGALADWEVAPGAPGEVLVAGDHVNRDYYRNPEAVRQNKVTDEDGTVWHRTGDIARRDTDGGLWLLGRRGRGWMVGGTRMWGLEVETPVADLPEVERAAVCTPKFEGAGREFKNATAVLAVEPADGFTRAEARDAAIRSLRERGLDTAIEVRSVKAVPVDRRHGTKVDVERLHAMLKPQSTDDY